jgi:predicted trehalose synthase
MSRRTRTTAAALTGAVALASGAYALGSQSGDGQAVARDGGQPRTLSRDADCVHGPIGFGLDDTADELGVSTEKLEQALSDFRDQQGDDARDDFAAALADALGIEASKVEDALASVKPDRPVHPPKPIGPPPERGRVFHHRIGPPVAKLARELGVSRAELRAALKEVAAGAEDRMKEHRQALVEFLADRLGVSEEKVGDALPDFPGRVKLAPPPGP